MKKQINILTFPLLNIKLHESLTASEKLSQVNPAQLCSLFLNSFSPYT